MGWKHKTCELAGWPPVSSIRVAAGRDHGSSWRGAVGKQAGWRKEAEPVGFADAFGLRFKGDKTKMTGKV